MNDFSFEVYNRRRDCLITYRVKFNKNGWFISYKAINGDCKPNGKPFFYMNFDQDYISYPSDFGDYLEYLWGEINTHELTAEEAQKKLQEI